MNKYSIESTRTQGRSLDSKIKVGGVTVAETETLFALMDDIKSTEFETEADDVLSSIEETVPVIEEAVPVKTDIIAELRNLNLQTILDKLPKQYLLERFLNHSSQFRRQIIYHTVQALRT